MQPSPKLRMVFSVACLVPAASVLVGCRGPAVIKDDRLTMARFEGAASADRTADVWEATQTALRDIRFRLDRVDRLAGVMTTMPELSQSVFEFWRDDVASSADLWESTINPVRRRAEVNFELDPRGEFTGVSVMVHKERLSAPDRQFNSTAAAYRLFGDTLPATSGQLPDGQEGPWWIDLGRDPAMEARLLNSILTRSRASATPVTHAVNPDA